MLMSDRRLDFYVSHLFSTSNSMLLQCTEEKMPSVVLKVSICLFKFCSCQLIPTVSLPMTC